MKDIFIKKLKDKGIFVTEECRINNCGDQLKLSNLAILNIFDSGKWNVQGKNASQTKAILEEAQIVPDSNNKVFVVYGHDLIARTQLEAMLRRWNLEPLILDQLPSAGSTIIEKLEEYTQQVNFGIVLATPDDIGFSKEEGPDKAKGRVRQNVVLELGMLLAAIGREKVAILLKEEENFERPSDINGLIYIPFKDNVEDAKVSLAKEMKGHSYNIDIANL